MLKADRDEGDIHQQVFVVVDNRHEPNELHDWRYWESKEDAESLAEALRHAFGTLPDAIQVIPLRRGQYGNM